MIVASRLIRWECRGLYFLTGASLLPTELAVIGRVLRMDSSLIAAAGEDAMVSLRGDGHDLMMTVYGKRGSETTVWRSLKENYTLALERTIKLYLGEV